MPYCIGIICGKHIYILGAVIYLLSPLLQVLALGRFLTSCTAVLRAALGPHSSQHPPPPPPPPRWPCLQTSNHAAVSAVRQPSPIMQPCCYTRFILL